jgi:hypothetical protein
MLLWILGRLGSGPGKVQGTELVRGPGKVANWLGEVRERFLGCAANPRLGLEARR